MSSAQAGFKLSRTTTMLWRHSKGAPKAFLPLLTGSFDAVFSECASEKDEEKGFQGLGDLIAYLSSSTQSKDVVVPFINKILEQDYSKFGEEKSAKNRVGHFLVEAMRLANFTLHDTTVLKSFKKSFDQMGVEWKGDPEKCIAHATFSALGFLTDHETGVGYVYTSV